MRHVGRKLLLALAYTYASTVDVSAQHVNLLSSPSAFQEAREVASDHDLKYLVTPAELKDSVESGVLVELENDGNHIFSGSFPYALPEAVTKLKEVVLEFKILCNRPLTIYSATRTAVTQPENAAANSLHRTGLAFDLEIPSEVSCRRWLESTLRFLERRKELFAWKVLKPAHYHVAINIDSPLVREPENSVTLTEVPVEIEMPGEESSVKEVEKEGGEKSFLLNLREVSNISTTSLLTWLAQLSLLVYILWGGFKLVPRRS